MGNFVDLTGKNFGEWTVLSYIGDRYWNCRCSCGQEVKVHGGSLTSGKSKSCGCKKIKYSIDSDFFKQIDTEEKAYTLGFIAADGSINIKNNLLKIEQKQEHDDILQKIANAMGYNNTIKVYSMRTSVKGKAYNINLSRLNISNKEIVSDVQKYGIVENKSNIMRINYELIPEELIRHFLRGIFEGDGCYAICHNAVNNGNPSFLLSLTSSTQNIEDIIRIIEDIIPGIKIYSYHRHEENKNNKTLIVTKQEKIVQFLDFIYHDAVIYQNYKYERYQEVINIYNNQNTIAIGGGVDE